MLDFTLTQDDLSKAARQLTRAREGAPDELVDFTCYTGNVKFAVTGREFTCAAAVTGKGGARLPLALLPKLRKLAASFGEEPVRLRVESGRIKINSMSVSSEAITVGAITDRPIDVPDNAPDIDILAFRYLFTQEEVAASGLAGRYMTAQSTRSKSIRAAALGLAAYVSASALERIVNDAIAAHAEILRPMLKPALGSKLLN